MTYSEAVRYQETHEWARREGDLIVVGISDYAQDSLGDVVYVEFPEVGTTKKKGDPFGVVESVKAASDVYMPVSGEIVAINESLEDSPGIVNESPFDSGWLLKVKPADPAEYEQLMPASEYKRYAEELEE